MVYDCPGTVTNFPFGTGYFPACDVPWVPAQTMLPNLDINDSLLISASIVGLLAIGYVVKILGRFISTF